MDLYYEQNVVNNNIDEKMRKTKTLSIAKTAMWVIGLFILVSSAANIVMIWLFLILALPFFLAAYILHRMNKRNNTEYDYVIDDEQIKISEIYFRNRRKLKYTIKLRSLESVGVFDSEGYKKVQHNVSKKILALVNYDDEKSIVYLLYNSEKGKRIVFIEPDRGFMFTLRRAVRSVTLFDKSISDLEKRLAERDSEIHAADDQSNDTETDVAESETPEIEDTEVTPVEDSVSPQADVAQEIDK